MSAPGRIPRLVAWDAEQQAAARKAKDGLGFRFTLAPAATVEGVVRGPDGKALSAGWVGLTSDPEAWEPDDFSPTTVLDVNGGFRLTEVDPATTGWLVVNAAGVSMRPVPLRDRLRLDRPLRLDVATTESTRFELEVVVGRPHEGLSVQLDDGAVVSLSASSLTLPSWTGHHRLRLLDAKGALLAEQRFDVPVHTEHRTVPLR